MIKQYVIDELRLKMDIAEVVGRFVDLKKNMACCPFHDERSPSFRVNVPKQIFKCFGCGEGGDAIKFIMKLERKTFIEAIEWLCNFYNITLEYDQAAQAEYEKTKDAREEQSALLRWAHKKYEALLHSLPAEAAAIKYLQQRGYDAERMRSWSMGFAPVDWKFLTSPAIEMGKSTPATDVGLISFSNGQGFDFFRNRITIPIHDHNGVLIGFGGRYVPTGDAEEDKKQAKYFNPKESVIYQKSKVLYALNLAQKAIKEAGFAYLVEGYMDAQAMHDAGINNTVATCGTEIDDAQVKLLKRFTEYVVIGYDADAAGTKKMMKAVNLFLRFDFKVQVLVLPDGKDPDEYISHLKSLEHEEAVA